MNGLASCLLGAAAGVGRRVPWAKHRFPMRTTFRHCLLANYGMSPEALAAALPRGLAPDVVRDERSGEERAFLSVVIADIEAMRPGFLPPALGFNFTQVVYRAIVVAPNGERGVYFVRSDADSVAMGAAGNIFSNFHFNLADCTWSGFSDLAAAAREVLAAAETSGRCRPELERREWLPRPRFEGEDDEGISSSIKEARFRSEARATDGEPAAVEVALDVGSSSLTMPERSIFEGQDVRLAQKYFVELYAAFNTWPEHGEWSAVRIDRTNWRVVAVEPVAGEPVRIDFMDRSSVFPAEAAELDSIFYAHALDYHWHAVDRQALAGQA